MRTLIIGLLGCAAVVNPAPAQADIVADWAELLTAVDDAASPPEYMFNPDTRQSWSKATLAMFEAANAIDRRYRSYVDLPLAPRGASSRAAVATAARDVLLACYPGEKKTIEDAYLASMANVPEGQARTDGIATGQRAAAAAMAAGGIDPKLGQAVYRPTAIPGKWAPSSLPYDPRELQVRPWFMTDASQLRIAPPPTLDSEAYAKSFEEVRTRGAKESKTRNATDTLAAKFWAFYELDPPMRQIADQPGRSTVQNARMYALVQMASDDIGLMMADGKLHHAFWRPMNAIRQADADGNDSTAPDPLWEPLVRTPAQPEYPCGHCTAAAVFSTILEGEGKPPPGGLHFTSERMKGVSMTVPDWPAYARAVDQSRIDAGVHFRFTAEASDPMGIKLGEMAMERLKPLR
ncbi:MAG: vanadium-dependent haloperoxidase [Pseudomonadota bacterium]